MIRPSRRALLAGVGTALASMVVGCVPAPRIRRHSAQDSATPAPELSELVRLLRLVAVHCAVAEHPWADALAALFTTHATVIARSDPLGGVQADPTPRSELAPQPTPGDAASAGWEQIIAETTQIVGLTHSLARTVGTDMGLLYRSTGLVAQVVSGNDLTSLPPPVTSGVVPTTLDGDLAPDSAKVLLARQDELVFVLETILGHLTDQGRRDLVTDLLGQAHKDRDQLLVGLGEAGITLPTSAPNHELGFDPTDQTAHDRQVGACEAAVMAAWLRFHAANPDLLPDRQQQAGVHAVRAMERGTALTTWPGWVAGE